MPTKMEMKRKSFDWARMKPKTFGPVSGGYPIRSCATAVPAPSSELQCAELRSLSLSELASGVAAVRERLEAQPRRVDTRVPPCPDDSELELLFDQAETERLCLRRWPVGRKPCRYD